MTTTTVGIDVQKTESQIAVVDDEGGPVDDRRIANDQLSNLAAEYAGSEAVIEASSNYFTIYDTPVGSVRGYGDRYPATRWIADSSKKTDPIYANCHELLEHSRWPAT